MRPPTIALLAALAISAVCGGGAITLQGGNEDDVINQRLQKPQQGTAQDFIPLLTNAISTTSNQDITELHARHARHRKKRTICLKCLMGKNLGGFIGRIGGCGGGGGCGGRMRGLIPVPVPIPVPMLGGGKGGGCGQPGCSSGGGRSMSSRRGNCGHGGCGAGSGYKQTAKPVEVVVPVKVTVVPSGSSGGCPTGRCYQAPPPSAPPRYPPSGGGCPTGGCYQSPPHPPPRHPPSMSGCSAGGCYQPLPQPVHLQPSRPKQTAHPVEVVVVTIVPSGSGGGGGSGGGRGGGGCPTGRCYQMPAPPRHAPSGGGCPMGGCYQPVHHQPSGMAQPQVCSTCAGGGSVGSYSYGHASSQASSSSYSSSWRKK